MNVGDQLKTCLLEWTWSWDFLVCRSLWLLFLLDCQYFREGYKSSYTFSNSLSWLILFFSNLLTKIQYFHHISLFPSGVLSPSFWFWLSVKVVLGVQRRVQVLICWVCLSSRELACGNCSVALIKICWVHCFNPHSKTSFPLFYISGLRLHPLLECRNLKGGGGGRKFLSYLYHQLIFD